MLLDLYKTEIANPSLDLFSTSQTKRYQRTKGRKRNDRQIYDTCCNNAPYFAYQIKGKKYGVVQGCCNDWNCPRCGQQRAKEEYGRIVSGARELAKTEKLYFLTLTCRGKEMSLEYAENHYQEWSNRLLTRLRTAQKRSGKTWAYVCVTERQERGHPHSHLITTYCPPDAQLVQKGGRKYFFTQDYWLEAKHATLQSKMVEYAVTGSGFGFQYDLSAIESVEAGSRYVSKYLFKASIFDTIWPKGWKRIRYSQNWPKLPEVKTDAFVLIDDLAWFKLSRLAVVIKTKDDGAKEFVKSHMYSADVIVQ